MKITQIIEEGFMDDFRQAAGEVDDERNETKGKYSRIQNSVSGYKEYVTMLDVIMDKAGKSAQLNRGETFSKEFPKSIQDKMVNIGLLNKRYGLADNLDEYLQWAVSMNMGDSTRRAAVNRNNPEARKKSQKMGNFPSNVNNDVDRADAKNRNDARASDEIDGTSTQNYGQARNRLIMKIRKLIPSVQKRLQDRQRKR